MTDKMALNPLDSGNGPMMSSDMDSHGVSGGVWGVKRSGFLLSHCFVLLAGGTSFNICFDIFELRRPPIMTV